MTTYYKAVRYDYGSFHNKGFKYGTVGTEVHHPHPICRTDNSDASNYLSVSTSPTDCTGFRWRVDGKDSRLLVVEPIGEVWTPSPKALPNKRACGAMRVVGELPISAAFGENADQVIAYLNLLPTLEPGQWLAARAAAWVAVRAAAWDAARAAARDAAWAAAWDAAWAAAWAAAWDAARAAAWAAARDATRDAARAAARDAARAAEALIVRDLITPEWFDTLTEPMRAAGINFDALY